jgi:glycosyltransferase involved in cell wall biosynthesis
MWDGRQVCLVARPATSPSGVGRYARSLQRELRTLGVDATLVPEAPPRLPKWLNHLAGRHGWDAAAFLSSYPLRLPLPPGALVHVTAQTFGSFLWAQPGCIVTIHDWVRAERGASMAGSATTALVDAMARQGLRRAQAVITDSEAIRQECFAHHLRPARGVHVVSLGFDPAIFRLRAPSVDVWQWLHLPEEAPFLLYVGTEAPRKNVAWLLKVLARLRATGAPDVLLVKVGPPIYSAQRDHLTDLAVNLGVSKQVCWLDSVDDARLVDLYNAAAVYVSAAQQEGFGLPVLEAMACGCPVVVSDISAHRELVGDAGALVSPTALDAWCAALHQRLHRPAERQRWSAQAILRARSFTWQETARQTLAVYRQTVALGDPLSWPARAPS